MHVIGISFRAIRPLSVCHRDQPSDSRGQRPVFGSLYQSSKTARRMVTDIDAFSSERTN